jgi:hypothetical protein
MMMSNDFDSPQSVPSFRRFLGLGIHVTFYFLVIALLWGLVGGNAMRMFAVAWIGPLTLHVLFVFLYRREMRAKRHGKFKRNQLYRVNEEGELEEVHHLDSETLSRLSGTVEATHHLETADGDTLEIVSAPASEGRSNQQSASE